MTNAKSYKAPKVNELVITPEMAAVGAEVLGHFERANDDWADTAALVYEVMERKRLSLVLV